MEKVKKIVLIGASGFVGSALLNEALNRDLEVTAVVRHPEKIKIENENLKVVKADVSALDEVTAVCKGSSDLVKVQMRLLVHSIRDGIILIYTMKQSKFI